MFKHSTSTHKYPALNRHSSANSGGSRMRYTLNGLGDAVFNANNYMMIRPRREDWSLAIAALKEYIFGKPQGPTYTVDKPAWPYEQPPVITINGRTFAVTSSQHQSFPDAVALRVLAGDPSWGIDWKSVPRSSVAELYSIVELVANDNANTSKKDDKKTATDEDCPPPENCVEKWVDKILHVSARPSNDAIEIPVAFKKLVCEGDMEEDPEVDCEELLKALQGSIAEGGVPGMMGLGLVIPTDPIGGAQGDTKGNAPKDYPPDWCNDCEERLVKASAYVTESPTAGSKPFKVKVKVLVCETDANPTIDCEEVLRALGAGLRAKRKSRTLKGLSESTRIIGTDVSTPQPTMPKSTDTASKQGQEFDTEANKLDPNRIQAEQAGMPWWSWILIGGAAIYAAKNLK